MMLNFDSYQTISTRQKQEMEVENLNLKLENAELNNLSKLMQQDMYETLNTSKRWEMLSFQWKFKFNAMNFVMTEV